MASKPQGDLIREQGLQIAGLVERVDSLKSDLSRVEHASLEVAKSHQASDKRIESLVRDIQHLEKRIEELATRRWDVQKIVLVAIIGFLSAAVVALLSKGVEKFGLFREPPPQQSSGRTKP